MLEPVVWVRCATPAQSAVIAALDARLRANGEDVRFATASDRHPEGKREVRRHIEHLKPILLLWIGGTLDAATLQAAAETNLPVVLIDVDETALDGLSSRWFTSRRRTMLGRLHAVFTRDQSSATQFIQAGAPQARTHAVGVLEDPPDVLPHLESDRRDIAAALRSRPVWLATQITLADIPMLADAQRHAARRSHRLLLCTIPSDPSQAAEMCDRFAQLGLASSLRSQEAEPVDAVQVHVIDAESDGEMGLWLRLATVTFAGGTLTQAAAQDPFEVAALGSVLIHGHQTDPFATRYERLVRAGATLQIDSQAGLGRAVEALLSADRVAAMATAGWDVTSRGAEATDRIASLIRDRLDQVGF